MRFFVMGLVAWLLAFAFVAWIAIVAGAIPMNADAAPPFVEQWAARTAVIAGIERRLTHGKNPAHGEAALLDGIAIYRDNCESCHGDASGMVQRFAKGFYQKPPQFAKSGIEQIPYSYTSWVIRHGIRFTAMPAFSPSLSRQQIDDVALFLRKMKTLSANERFAWSGARIRPELQATYVAVGGFRQCLYLPSPSARPHHFVSVSVPSSDGTFLVEHFYNRGISELSVIGVDASHHRLVRTRLAKDGTADVAVSPIGSATIWQSGNGAKTKISPLRDGSYVFRSTDAPGFGRCQRRTAME